MSNATPSRIGQANSAGSVDALFLKVFSGEVLASFNTKTVMKDRTRTRKISSGKSAQFPAIGKIGAEYHVPGAEILGDAVEHGEKVITIDDLLISSAFIANIDEAKTHYEVRAEYSRQMGDALAQAYDRNLLSMAVKAAANAEAGAVADQGQASAIAIGATPTTTEVITALYQAAENLDVANVAEEGRFAVVAPSTYYALVQDDKLVNRDFVAGNGDYADGKVLRVAGMEIVKSNNLSIDHTATGTRVPNLAKYDVDASAVRALVLSPEALGTVQLLDVASESEYDIRRQGNLMVSKMACGHGVLRPEGIVTVTAS